MQVLSNVSERVQAIVREFSAATSQHEEAKGELRGIERSLRSAVAQNPYKLAGFKKALRGFFCRNT